MNEHASLTDPALQLAIAMAVGMLAQSLARHLRVPGIVLLLGAGLLLGPDLLGIIRPEALGGTLQMLVGFAVAVILFEGGLNLNIRRLRREARSIQGLVTVGAAVTGVGGALAARLFLGWEWRLAILFGALVIVTGPTVIGPILRRVRLNRGLATVLEAEGVLIDPIGAIAAVVALEIVLHPGETLVSGAAALVLRLGIGALIGVVGGALIVAVLRWERLVPEGLENVFILSLVLTLFHVSNTLLSESGIMAVTIAGLVVGNFEARKLRDLKEFKEQLTVMLIGVLFVLLAADVRVDDIRELGLGGLLTVLALMLVVRPLNVWIGTAGSGLSNKEKAFLSWMAPRGIVAAAVSSLFAQELDAAGIPGGSQLRALVFLVIAATVLIQGLSGGLLAGWLGVRRPNRQGQVILGAGKLALAFGEIFHAAGREVIFLDSNPAACREAEERGLRVFYGNALEPRLLIRAEVESRVGCYALTPNDEVNLLFARRVHEASKETRNWVALGRVRANVTSEMVERLGAHVLFDTLQYLSLWNTRLERERATVEAWVCDTARPAAKPNGDDRAETRELSRVLLPLAVERNGTVQPHSVRLGLQAGDLVHVLVSTERRDEALDWLRGQGWRPAEAPEGEAASVSSQG